jgi:hypothetical protein
MLNNCANPQCAKPLHYLRDGRIFVFDSGRTADDGAGNKAHRMEHYWLCGACSATMILEKTRTGVRVVDKVSIRMRRAEDMATKEMAGRAMAS